MLKAVMILGILAEHDGLLHRGQCLFVVPETGVKGGQVEVCVSKAFVDVVARKLGNVAADNVIGSNVKAVHRSGILVQSQAVEVRQEICFGQAWIRLEDDLQFMLQLDRT